MRMGKDIFLYCLELDINNKKKEKNQTRKEKILGIRKLH